MSLSGGAKYAQKLLPKAVHSMSGVEGRRERKSRDAKGQMPVHYPAHGKGARANERGQRWIAQFVA